MHFDPDNHVVILCAQGMNVEGTAEAVLLFEQAWNEATNDFEKFIAAHYLARQQKTVAEKLKWDQTALHCALQVNDERVKAAFPSLYLNIAKCHEDLKDFAHAKEHYELALSHSALLPDDGYATHIRRGIENGINRMKEFSD